MVICIVKDSSGNHVGTFHPQGEKNLVDEAADNGIEIPFSCHAGACMSCAAKIIRGHELLEAEKDGPKYLETDSDIELMCIAGVNKEYVESEKNFELEIETHG
jgi:ferredoxin